MVLKFIQRFLAARAGATILEYSLVAPIFFLLLFAIVEYGLFTFHSVAIESAVMQSARTASLGRSNASTGACTATSDRVGYLQCVLRDKTSGLINASSIVITANTVAGGGVPASATPDICFGNPPRVGGVCPTGTPWQDVNGNGVYDAGTALTVASLGNAGDLVEVRVYYPWKVQIPFMKEFFGCRGNPGPGCQQGVAMITSATVLKNEPFNSGSAGSSSGTSAPPSSSSSSTSASSSSSTSASSSGSSTSASSTSSTSSTSTGSGGRAGGGCARCGINDSFSLE